MRPFFFLGCFLMLPFSREDLALLAVHKTDSEQKLFVFFINDEKVGVQPIRA